MLQSQELMQITEEAISSRDGYPEGLSHRKPFSLMQMSTWTPCQQLVISYSLMVVQLSISSGLILTNKYLLSVVGFGYPIVLSSLGMLASAIGCRLIVDVFELVTIPTETRRMIDFRFQMRRLQPIAIIAAGTLATGNYAYMYLTVSIIQILKSFTPVMTLTILVMFRMAVLTLPLVVSVIVITVGCTVAAKGEVDTAGGSTLFGLAVFFSSELAECLRVVILQYLIEGRSNVKLDAVALLYYVSPYAFLWCQVFAVFLEYSSFWQKGGHKLIIASPLAFGIAALMGLGVNLLAFLVIQTIRGGSLTFKIAQMVKNALVVLVSSYIFWNEISTVVSIGYALSLVGFMWYTLLTHDKDKARPVAAAATSSDANPIGQPSCSRH